MGAISELKRLPETKAEINTYSKAAICEILDGEVDVLKAYKHMSAIQETFEAIKKDKNVKELAVTEALKHGKSFDYYGCNYQVKETGVKYDYSECGDSCLDDLYDELARLKQQIKERENFLKSLKPEMEIADAASGELLNAPSKTSTTTVVVTIK